MTSSARMESAVEVFDDGERRDEFGPNPEGYLCYNSAGIVPATLGDSARRPVSAGDPQSATNDRYEKIASRFIAYVGPFTVDLDNAAVTPPRRRLPVPELARPRPSPPRHHRRRTAKHHRLQTNLARRPDLPQRT
jgi:lipocalin-like protein